MGENFEKRDLQYEIQHAIFIVMIPGFKLLTLSERYI